MVKEEHPHTNQIHQLRNGESIESKNHFNNLQRRADQTNMYVTQVRKQISTVKTVHGTLLMAVQVTSVSAFLRASLTCKPSFLTVPESRTKMASQLLSERCSKHRKAQPKSDCDTSNIVGTFESHRRTCLTSRKFNKFGHLQPMPHLPSQV